MDIHKSILKLIPDFRCVVWENDYAKIKAHELETRPIPDLTDLEAVWPQIEYDEAAEAQAEADRIAAKAQAFIDNLPSWTVVEAAVNNIASLADAKVFLNKLARVVYWLAKNKAD